MHVGRFIIMRVQKGEPVSAERVLGPYKTNIGVAVKDYMPIKYRYWSG
uniref:Uncharacterized protein n=1 Tax=Arundo donax TaxID=35708 RepID=A0A0A9BR42_ARUDO